MEKKEIAEILKQKILDIETSKRDSDTENRIMTVTVSADVFLSMAYLFVGTHG